MKKGLLAMLVLGLLLFLAACGGGDSSDNDGSDDTGSDGGDSTEASSTLDISATNWKFNKDEYTVSAGEEVNVSLTNKEGNHGLAIDEYDVDISGGGDATFTPEEPGEYTIHCSIPCGKGHSDMKSTLVVE